MKKNFLALFLLTACVSSVLVVKSADSQDIQDVEDDNPIVFEDDNQIVFGGKIEALEDANVAFVDRIKYLERDNVAFGGRIEALERDNKIKTQNLAAFGGRIEALEVDKTKTQTLTNLAQLSRRVEVLEKNGQLSGRFDSVKKSQASSQRLPMSDRLFGFVGASATVTSVAKWTGFATPFVTKIAPLISNLSGITSLSYVGVVAKGACAGLTYAGSYAGTFYGLSVLLLAKTLYDKRNTVSIRSTDTSKSFLGSFATHNLKLVTHNLKLVINTIAPVAQLAGLLVILGMLAEKNKLNSLALKI